MIMHVPEQAFFSLKCTFERKNGYSTSPSRAGNPMLHAHESIVSEATCLMAMRGSPLGVFGGFAHRSIAGVGQVHLN